MHNKLVETNIKVYNCYSKLMKNIDDNGVKIWCLKDGISGYLVYWEYDMECEVVFFCNLLFCDEINVVYILDYHGYMTHVSLPDNVYCKQKHNKNDKVVMCILDDIKKIIIQMFVNIKSVRLYTKANFQSELQMYINNIKNSVTVLELPDLVLMNIFKMLCPLWLFYKHNPLKWNDEMNKYEAFTEHQIEFKDIMIDIMESWEYVRGLHIQEHKSLSCHHRLFFPRVALSITVPMTERKKLSDNN